MSVSWPLDTYDGVRETWVPCTVCLPKYWLTFSKLPKGELVSLYKSVGYMIVIISYICCLCISIVYIQQPAWCVSVTILAQVISCTHLRGSFRFGVSVTQVSSQHHTTNTLALSLLYTWDTFPRPLLHYWQSVTRRYPCVGKRKRKDTCALIPQFAIHYALRETSQSVTFQDVFPKQWRSIGTVHRAYNTRSYKKCT